MPADVVAQAIAGSLVLVVARRDVRVTVGEVAVAQTANRSYVVSYYLGLSTIERLTAHFIRR